MFTRSTTTRLCIATGLAIGIASAGLAQQGPVTVTARAPAEQHLTQRVSYADLNLASEVDQRTLFRRVHVAARQVCLPTAYESLLTAQEEDGCFHQALLGARPQIAQAITRATQIATLGTSSIPAMGIAVSAAL